MIQCLDKLSKVIDIGFVSGSDLVKVKQQLNEQAIEKCSYFFSENGLKAFKGSELIGEEVIVKICSKSEIFQDKKSYKSLLTFA